MKKVHYFLEKRLKLQ